MKSIKTIALALAISTGGSTMQAGGQQQVALRNSGSLLKNVIAYGVPILIALKIATLFKPKDDDLLIWDKLESILAASEKARNQSNNPLDGFRALNDSASKWETYEKVRKPFWYGAGALSGLIAYRVSRRLLTRMLGTQEGQNETH